MLKTCKLQIFLLILSALVSSSFAQSKLQITVQTEASVKNEIIKFQDFANVSGENENSKRLRNLSFGYAPNIGLTRMISLRKIKLVIAAAGFSVNKFSLQSPETVYIKRVGQIVEHPKIREVIEETISNRFTNNGVEAKIVRLEIPKLREVPLGNVEIRTSLANIRNIFAPFSLPLEIRVNNRTVQRFSAKVEIEAFAEVFVAAKDLFSNTRLLETEVRLEKRRLEKIPQKYLRKKEKLRGIKLVRDIPNGTALTSDAFVADIVVKSGDLVRIVGQSGKLRISINGKARANGRIGDRIAVKNLQSDKLLQATVIDEGLVKVFF